MKTTLSIIACLVLSFSAQAGNGNKTEAYQVGHVYRLNDGKYMYIGKDENGAHKFEGYKNEAGIKPVKKAPRFNSKTRKVTKRKFNN